MAPDAVNAILDQSDRLTKQVALQVEDNEKIEVELIEIYDEFKKTEDHRFSEVARVHAMRLALAQKLMSGQVDPYAQDEAAVGIQTLGQLIAFTESDIVDLGRKSKALADRLAERAAHLAACRRTEAQLRAARSVVDGYRFEA